MPKVSCTVSFWGTSQSLPSVVSQVQQENGGMLPRAHQAAPSLSSSSYKPTLQFDSMYGVKQNTNQSFVVIGMLETKFYAVRRVNLEGTCITAPDGRMTSELQRIWKKNVVG
jgi:hypothetical protein